MFVPVQLGKGHAAPIYDLVTDGRSVFTTAGDKYVVKWNLETGLQDGFTIQLDTAAYVLELIENILYIGSTNGTITALDTLKKRVIWEHNLFGNPWMSLCAQAKENQLFAGDSAGNLILLDALTGEKQIHLPFACGRIRQIQCKEAHIWLATQQAGIIQIDRNTMNELKRFNPHADSVNRLVIKNHLVVSVGKDGYLCQTNWNELETIKRIPIHYQAIYGLIENFDNWITCSMDKSIKVWDQSLEQILQKIEIKEGGHKKSVNGIRKLSDQAFITFSDDQTWISWRNKLTALSWSEN